jgi:mannose-1-phosphate guanylyltransferase/phosphomannomutase
VVKPEILQRIPSRQNYDFGNDLFPRLLASGLPLYGVETEGYLLDIGAPERYFQAEVDFAAGRQTHNRTAVSALG